MQILWIDAIYDPIKEGRFNRINALNNGITTHKNVIRISEFKDLDDFKSQVQAHQGEFDRVFINSHGSKGKLMPSLSIGKVRSSLSEIINIINKGNEANLKKICVASCHIGYQFESIKEGNISSIYHQKLNHSLMNGQELYLYGDDFHVTSLSTGTRLNSLAQQENYDISDMILDSADITNMVVKKSHKLFGFSYPPFGIMGVGGEDLSENSVQRYLKKMLRTAEDFKKEVGITNSVTKAETRLENADYQYFHHYLNNRYILDCHKISASSNKTLINRYIENNIDARYDRKIKSIVASPAFTLRVIIKGFYEPLKILIEKGFNVNSQDSYGRTGLDYSLMFGNPECTALLRNAGAKASVELNPELKIDSPEMINLYSPYIIKAAKDGRLEALKLLVEIGLNVNTIDSSGLTLLDLTVLNNRHKCKAYLKDAEAKTSAEINSKLKVNFTAIKNRYAPYVINAAKDGELDALKLLVELGFNINTRDTNGSTLLDLTVLNNRPRCETYLLNAGAKNSSELEHDLENETPKNSERENPTFYEFINGSNTDINNTLESLNLTTPYAQPNSTIDNRVKKFRDSSDHNKGPNNINSVSLNFNILLASEAVLALIVVVGFLYKKVSGNKSNKLNNSNLLESSPSSSVSATKNDSEQFVRKSQNHKEL